MTREQLIKEACRLFNCKKDQVELRDSGFTQFVDLYVFGVFKASYKVSHDNF